MQSTRSGDRPPDVKWALDEMNRWSARAHEAEQARDRLANWIEERIEGSEVDRQIGLVIT